MTSFTKTDIQFAYRLIKEFETPNPWIYWLDLVGTIVLFWSSLFLSFTYDDFLLKCVFELISIFSLYRGMLFVHEITHLKKNTVPGLSIFWNCALGIPLLMPSYIFESHHDHHARERYATDQDPEYDFYTTSPISVLLLYLSSGLYMPFVLIVRQSILVPLSYFIRPVRTFLDEQGSGATIHNRYRRRKPTNKTKLLTWRCVEALSALSCLSWIGLTIAGWIPWPFFAHLLVAAIFAFTLNNFRAVTSHRFALTKGPYDFDKQVSDSLNFDQGKLWVHLWAPVGMRYHALHHLFPNLPYHNLTKAHQKLLRELPSHSPYRNVNQAHYWGAFKQLLYATLKNKQ
ncbi:fatty acid desaturase family protein [Terasakiella pusilla]|jgi:fatty acid desaturase|uniref:fatty acid desaturase family protein n=1 Tax=Terasakiella pusilla TaxID=64973 RepID=UPI003AA8D7A1